MHKKILLSIFFALSLLGISQNVIAGIITYVPGAGNTYTFTISETDSTYQGMRLDSLPFPLTNLLEVGGVVKESIARGETFNFDDDSSIVFQNDLLAQKPILLNDVAVGIATLTGEPFTTGRLTEIIAVLENVKKHGAPPFNEIQLIDVFSLTSARLNAIEDITRSLKIITATVDRVSDIIDNNRAAINQIASTNPRVAFLQGAVDQLRPIINSGVAAPQEVYFNYYNAKFGIFNILKLAPENSDLIKSPQSQEDLKIIANAVQTIVRLRRDKSPDSQTLANILESFLLDAKTHANKDLTPVQKADTHTTGGIMGASLANTGVITDRLSGFTSQGIAAGDIFQTYGAWIKGTIGMGEQRPFKSEPGYKFNQKGFTIGIDTGDESVFGAAFSFFKADNTSKDNSSTKDNTLTRIASIYGLHVINPEFFLSGQITYGTSIITKTRRTGDLANNVATAKPTAIVATRKAELGYIYAINETTQLIPTLGFAHNKVDVKPYSESGNGLNRKVSKRTTVRTSGTAGLTLRHATEMQSVKLMPEIHTNFDYAFINTNSDTIITVADALTVSTPSKKLSKLYINIGGSVKFAASKTIDLMVGYDLGLATKFMSHTGNLKLKVNF